VTELERAAGTRKREDGQEARHRAPPSQVGGPARSSGLRSPDAYSSGFAWRGSAQRKTPGYHISNPHRCRLPITGIPGLWVIPFSPTCASAPAGSSAAEMRSALIARLKRLETVRAVEESNHRLKIESPT
jgi:hypothetical protein